MEVKMVLFTTLPSYVLKTFHEDVNSLIESFFSILVSAVAESVFIVSGMML